MASAIGFGALAEFGFGETGDDVSSFTVVAATDSLLPKLTEASNATAKLGRADSVLVLLTDVSRSVAATLGRADSLTPRIDEARTIRATVGTADVLTPKAVDNAGAAVTLRTTESLLPKLTELVRTPYVVVLSRGDSLLVVVSRFANGAGFGALGELGLGEHDRDVNTLPLSQEAATILARLARADSVLPKTTETSAAPATLRSTETILPKLIEGIGRAEPRLSKRIISVIKY